MKRCVLTKRNAPTNRSSNQNIAEFFYLLPVVLFQTNENRKTTLSLQNIRSFIAADGNLRHFQHISDVQTVACDLIAVDGDLQMFFTSYLLNCEVFDPSNIRHRLPH